MRKSYLPNGDTELEKGRTRALLYTQLLKGTQDSIIMTYFFCQCQIQGITILNNDVAKY